MKKAAGRTCAALSPPTQGNGGAAGQGRRHQSPAVVTGHPFLHAHCTTTVFQGCASRASPFPPHCRENTPGGQNAGGAQPETTPGLGQLPAGGPSWERLARIPQERKSKQRARGLICPCWRSPAPLFSAPPPNTSRPPGTTAAPQLEPLTRNLLREQRFHRPSQSHRLREAKEIK